MIVMGIETSCDETSVAVLKDYTILSNVISSQAKVHERFGGVVPELASRHHLDNITWLLQEALQQAAIEPRSIEGIGVTYGPGLVGSLLVGLNLAKAVSFAWGIPFVGVNHLEAHVHSVFLEHREVEMPMLSLIASGGHTSLYHVITMDEYRRLGETRDDAVGEAFDKVAKMLGLGYPGGPVIDRIAKGLAGNSAGFQKANFHADNYDFSYSGLKTAVLYYMQKNQIERYSGTGEYPEEIVEICRSFQTVAIGMLMDAVRKAAERLKPRSVSFSGGVAANSFLRTAAGEWGTEAGVPVYFPSLILSTDNAAMIAAVAQHKLSKGLRDSMQLNAQPSLRY